MITVVLAANGNYFNGLAVTLKSLLQSNQTNLFEIRIIDGGLNSNQKRFITGQATEHNGANRVCFHVLNATLFQGFRLDYGDSYMTYARILVGSLIDAERILYLDTDLMVAADVRPLWEVALGSCMVAASPDPNLRFLHEDYPFDEDCGDEPYFNAGVMIIDLRRWREENVESRLLAMIAKAPDKFRWWDQTAMNALFRKQVLYVDPGWNTFADAVDLRDVNRGKIFHYVGSSKPWNKYLATVEYRLWRRFYHVYVRSSIFLFMDWRFLISFLRHVRHNLLLRNRFLRGVALRWLNATARFRDGASSDSVERLHGNGAENFRINEFLKTNDDNKLAHYLEARWGSTEMQ